MKQLPSLTTDPIRHLTWRIALPTSIGMFFQTMFHFVDTYFAGQLHTDALAALSLSFPVFFLIIAVGSGLSQGTTALIANALGAKNHEKARKIYIQSILLASFVGVILSVVGYYFSPSVFQWLGADGNYLSMCLAYMQTLLMGATFFLLTVTVNAGLSAQGENRPYRNFLILGFLANCLLNPLLMKGFWMIPAMGISGIALATIFVQGSGVIYLWMHAKKTMIAEDLAPGSWHWDRSTTREIASQSIPAALNMFTIAAGIFVMTYYVKSFGKEAVAAVGIGTRIEQIVLMPVIGLGSAMLSIVGQNHGAGLPHRVKEAWLINVSQGAILMIFGGLIVGLCGPYFFQIFSDDPMVLYHGKNFLFTAALTLAAYPILFITVFMMQALKRPNYGLWVGLYRQIIAPIFVYQFLVHSLAWGIWGVWWGVSFVTWSAALFALWWGWRVVNEYRRAPSTELTSSRD